MKIANEVFYQVATDRNYKIGDKLIFNKDVNNGQYNRVFNTEFIINEHKLSDEMYSIAKRKFKKFSKKEDIYNIAHKLEAYDVVLKELALEEVRKEYFNDLPSRFHCMFLSVSKEIALKNMESMANNREKIGKVFQAIAVKLNGNIFKVGKVYVNREGKSFAYYKKKAFEYWSQKDLKEHEIKEILFEGECEIIDILGEIRK